MKPDEKVSLDTAGGNTLTIEILDAIDELECVYLAGIDATVAAAIRLSELRGDEARTLVRVRQLLLLTDRLSSEAKERISAAQELIENERPTKQAD